LSNNCAAIFFKLTKNTFSAQYFRSSFTYCFKIATSAVAMNKIRS